ncbi:MAG: M16 family metallopeptidase [Prevotella sp.]
MKKLYLTFLLLFLLSAPLFAQRPSLTSFTLSNGMTVWLNEDHAQPKVFGAVVVKAGAKDCPNSGIAHYLEHLLFKGTQKIGTTDYAKEKPWLDSISFQYDLLAKTKDAARRLAIQRHINDLSIHAADYAIPNEFGNLIDRFGGTGLNAYTSFDETVFHNSFSPQYIRQWCELNAERMRDPVFRLFQGELETVYEEKNMYTDNLLASTAEKAQQMALAGTPYAYPIIGATDSLKNPRLSEMMRFFRERYVPTNMGLVLCGDIQADSLRPLLERTFGTLRASGEAFTPTPRAQLRDFTHMPVLRLKVPIPIVKVGGRIWQMPDEKSKDYAPFQVLASMLTNEEKTGLIDSLMTSSRVLFATGMGYNFKDFSAWGFGFVPRLPFGSRKKAEKLCLEQIDKLKQGRFSDAVLQATKLTLKRDAEMSMETVSGRSQAMINAFSHGLSWESVAGRGESIDSVSREDVMRVAQKYLNDNCLRLAKKFGHYPKEHVSQPGYKPVKPKNADKQSAYAMTIEQEPTPSAIPRTLDLDKDATCTPLSKLVNLYTVPNPQNDVFTLKLIYRRGSRKDNRLSSMADYLNSIGTVSHDKHAFGSLLRRYGATLSAEASTSDVTLTLTGIDRYFKEAVSLLHEFLTSPKADKKQFDALVKSTRFDERTIFKQNSNIARIVLQKIAFGDRSDYLTRVTAKELKQMGGDSLVSVFKNLQHCQTDIVYCGSLNTNDIENILKDNISVDKVTQAWTPGSIQLQPVKENTVYIYDNPSARQTIVGCYEQTAPMPTAKDRAQLRLWSSYFGGGMQSVLFQEVREFRALAYSAHGYSITPDLLTRGAVACGYVSQIGTQADKAMTTTLLLDSLLSHMPLREAQVETASHVIVNGINNSFPTMRQIGSDIATLRLLGYSHDPEADIIQSLAPMTASDLMKFYGENIQSRPRALFIVGNKKMLDMKRLSKIGKIVEVKKQDIYK